MSIQMQKDRRIGSVLIGQGVLTESQVQEILEWQKTHSMPFGQAARQLFNIDEATIWKAWAMQMGPYLAHVDIAGQQPDERVLTLLRAQEAWRLCALPLRLDEGHLVVATTLETLPDAAAYFHVRSDLFVEFVIGEKLQIEQAIMQSYPKLAKAATLTASRRTA